MVSPVAAANVCTGVSLISDGLAVPVAPAARTGVTRNVYVVPVVKPVTVYATAEVVVPVGAPATAVAEVNVAPAAPQFTEQYSTK